MSNFHAVATVTSALRNRLLAIVQADVPGSSVSILRPGEAGSGGLPDRGVNIFLYQVRTNAAQRNRDLPTRRADGTLSHRPQVALDLDYLFSFYGEQNLVGQRLLAVTLRSLHARPVLTDAMVQAGEGGTPSRLAEQVDPVKLVPLDLSLEDLSRLWSVFFQTRYVLSAAFRAGPVLIEAELPPPVPAPPVLVSGLHVVTLRQPVIRQVVAEADPDRPITAGARIAILGERLRGEITRVLIGEAALAPVTPMAENRLVVDLPATLRAGPQGVRVRHDVAMGLPPTPRPGIASGLAAFSLYPEIERPGGSFAVAVANLQVAGGLASADVAVTLRPAVAPGQAAVLELIDPGSGAVTSVTAPPRSAATTSLTFAVAGVTPAEYLVRIRVDGAESALVEDLAAGALVPRIRLVPP